MDNQERALARAGWRRPNDATIAWIGLACLVLLYLAAYAAAPAAPGNNPAEPLGWWGWFDQGNYFKSAYSLSVGALDQDRHWYPLGYAIVAAPFMRASPAHGFLVPDLLCLSAAYGGFLLFAREVGFGRPVAVLAFLFGTMGGASIRAAWAQPWNTTLAAALIWLLLAAGARLIVQRPAPLPRSALVVACGVLGAALVATRPTDLVTLALFTTGVAASGWARRALRWLDAPLLAAGALLVALPYGALYLRIYGWHETPYMALSGRIGFSVAGLPWRSYLLLITPRPWFPDGAGLLERLPWIAPGLLAIPILVLFRPRDAAPARDALAVLALLVAATWFLFFCYVDLQPPGLWRFSNVHYFKWTLPGLLLLGLALVRMLAAASGPARVLLCGAIVALAIPLCVQVKPRPAAPGQTVRMVQVHTRTPAPFFQTYFGSSIVTDARGEAVNTIDLRAIPDSQGLRLVMLDRALRDVERIRVAGTVEPAADWTEWTSLTRLGWPCWLPPYRCDRRAPPP